MTKQNPAGFEVGNGTTPGKKEGGGLKKLFNAAAAPVAALGKALKWGLGKAWDGAGWAWDNKSQAAGILLIAFPAAGGLFNAANPNVNPVFGFNQGTGTAMWDGAAKVYEFEGAVAMAAVRGVSGAYNAVASGANVVGIDLPTFNQDKTQGDIQYVLTCNPYHRGTLHPLSGDTTMAQRYETISSNKHYRFMDEQIQAAMMDGNHQMHDKMADGYHPVILVPPSYSQNNKTLTFSYKHTADEQVCPSSHPYAVRTPVTQQP